MATIKKFEEIESWQLADLAELVVSKAGALIGYLNKSEYKGEKFKGRALSGTIKTQLQTT